MKVRPFTIEEAYAHVKRMGYFRTVMAIAVSRALRDWGRYA